MQPCHVLFGMVLILQGCGAIYVSPRVVDQNDNVLVRQLTGESLVSANQTDYTPRRLPDYFTQNARVSGNALGVGPLPDLGSPPVVTPMKTSIPPAVDPGPYLIGVGDVVSIQTQAPHRISESLAGGVATQTHVQEYTVRDDGGITIPDVGSVIIGGLTVDQAETALFQSLISAQINPKFSFDITQFNAASVSLGGAVNAPVVIAMDLTPLYLDEALTRAGGIVVADRDYVSIRMYRDDTLYQIPFAQYLDDPGLQKLRLVAGDSIFVDVTFELEQAHAYFEKQIALTQWRQQARVQALAALTAEMDLQRATLTEQRTNFQDRAVLDAVPRDYVYLTGEVSEPGRFALPFESYASLADALYAKGGFSNKTANSSQIYVLRGDENGQITAWQLDGRNAANLVLATRMTMLPNDIIFIAEQPVTRWHRVIQQIVPSLITSGAGLAVN